jgi:hypothetical protein
MTGRSSGKHCSFSSARNVGGCRFGVLFPAKSCRGFSYVVRKGGNKWETNRTDPGVFFFSSGHVSRVCEGRGFRLRKGWFDVWW